MPESLSARLTAVISHLLITPLVLYSFSSWFIVTWFIVKIIITLSDFNIHVGALSIFWPLNSQNRFSLTTSSTLLIYSFPRFVIPSNPSLPMLQREASHSLTPLLSLVQSLSISSFNNSSILIGDTIHWHFCLFSAFHLLMSSFPSLSNLESLLPYYNPCAHPQRLSLSFSPFHFLSKTPVLVKSNSQPT